MSSKQKSPDMVIYDDVISVISNYPNCFKGEKEMAQILRCISNLEKYDLHPVADNITNNHTTVNVIAEDSKVRDFLIGLKSSLEDGKRRY